jgi:hypothetical protein
VSDELGPTPIANAPTRFDGISRARAAMILAATVAALIACLFASRSGAHRRVPDESGLTDSEVLLRIVERVHSGQGYYPAAAVELRDNGYRVRSVFSWREPLYAWFLGALPTPAIGWMLLIGLALLAIRAPIRVAIARHDAWMIMLCLFLVPGAIYGCFLPWGVTTLETWAGVLIALSIFSYANGRWMSGLLLALLALFIRELVAPYVLICIALACWNKRWREVGGWAVGLMFFAAYYAFHARHALASMLPSDPPTVGWVQFGGLHFILTTASQPLLLQGAPLWVTALFLPPAVLGLCAIPGDLGRRIVSTVAAYFLFFACVGKSFNDYWGFLYSPLLAFGFAWLPVAMSRLMNNSAETLPESRHC